MYNTFIFVYLICHLDYPTVRKESFWVMPRGILLLIDKVILWFMYSVSLIKAINNISTAFFWCICFHAFNITLFNSQFTPIFLTWYRVIMIFHEIDFLCIFVELNIFATLRLSAGAGFFILMRPLRGVLIGIDIKYFTLFSGMSGAMQNACLFSTGRWITWMTCIFVLR